VIARIAFVASLLMLSCHAVAAADQALCSSSEAIAHRDQATSFYKHGNLASAITELTAAIRACPTEPFHRFMLGNALYRAGRLKESATSYAAFLDDRPYHMEGHMSLGFTLFELGDKTGALHHWTVAERIEPESPFARAALAVGLYATGDPENAAIQYDRAKTLDSRYGDSVALAIDIRWKEPVRAILAEIERLKESSKGDR
jgi:tetratricopeptide (TPR) repeat protein